MYSRMVLSSLPRASPSYGDTGAHSSTLYVEMCAAVFLQRFEGTLAGSCRGGGTSDRTFHESILQPREGECLPVRQLCSSTSRAASCPFVDDACL